MLSDFYDAARSNAVDSSEVSRSLALRIPDFYIGKLSIGELAANSLRFGEHLLVRFYNMLPSRASNNSVNKADGNMELFCQDSHRNISAGVKI